MTPHQREIVRNGLRSYELRAILASLTDAEIFSVQQVVCSVASKRRLSDPAYRRRWYAGRLAAGIPLNKALAE